MNAFFPSLEQPTARSLFETITQAPQVAPAPAKREALSYHVSEVPRAPQGLLPTFVYGRFMPKQATALATNQTTVVSLAVALFAGSRPLDELEQTVLNRTLKRLSKKTPSRPNRK